MSAIYPFPAPYRADRGTIHIWGDAVQGFSVSHESSSGGSWGEILGPFERGNDAIAAAYALNLDTYSGSCNVAVSDAALREMEAL